MYRGYGPSSPRPFDSMNNQLTLKPPVCHLVVGGNQEQRGSRWEVDCRLERSSIIDNAIDQFTAVDSDGDRITKLMKSKMMQTQLTHTASGTSRLCKWHAVLIYSNGPKLDVARVLLSHGALTSASTLETYINYIKHSTCDSTCVD